MKEKQYRNITLIIVSILAGLLGGFGFYNANKNKSNDEIIDSAVNEVLDYIDNKSSTEIPSLTETDEQSLEVQETEAEGFEEQGIVAYNGSEKAPNVQLGEYAGLTYYSQLDNRWRYNMYSSVGDSSQTIGTSGCGPTSAAMVVSSIKGNITPDTMANLYTQYGYRSANQGTYWSAFKWTADVFDIGYSECYKLDDAIVIFQPELRRGLEQLGTNKFTKFFGLDSDLATKTKEDIYKVVIAASELSKTKTGALIVLERDINIQDIIATGVPMNSEVSPQLLVNIFVPKTPLHDGAVVISNNKIAAAACVLPLADDTDIAKELGTRHRAAIGISKESDSIVVVVSEETGKISVAKDGTLIADVREDVLKKILISNIVTKRFTQKKTVKNNKFENIKKRFNKKPETETKENENK